MDKNQQTLICGANTITKKTMKTKLFVENLGDYVRVSLKRGQNDIAQTMFANLSWTCKDRRLPEEVGNFSMFMCNLKKFKRAVQAFTQVRAGEVFDIEYITQQVSQVSDYTPYIYNVRAVNFSKLQFQNRES